MISTVRRTQVIKFIEVVKNAGLAENGKRDHTAAEIADGQSVRLGRTKKIVGRFTAAAAGHELHDDFGITRNIFLQERHQSSDSKISRTTRIPALNDGDRLPLKERSLGKHLGC